MDGFVHPYPKMPWLPLLINLFFVGWGTTISALIKEGGPCWKTVGLGVVSTFLFVICLEFGYFTLGISWLVSLALFILHVYIGYLGMQKCK